MKEQVTAFTIDRREWRRKLAAGESSYLMRDDGDHGRCCVGIYLRACGVADTVLVGMQNVGSLSGALPEQSQWLRDGRGLETTAALELYRTNDETGDEEEIARLFATQGITVTFTGEE